MKIVLKEKFIIINVILIVTSGIGFLSCEDFVTISPPDSEIVTENVFNDWNAANAAMLSLYPQIGSFNKAIQDYAGLYGDEFVTNSTTGLQFVSYTNSLNAETYNHSETWNTGYNIIYQANAIIEGSWSSDLLNEDQKSLLLAEASFARAFCHFYLYNLFGDIPLVLTTDYEKNSRLARSSREQVFQQIIADLENARSRLTNDYIDEFGIPGTTERVRPNRHAATSLLSRVYLFDNEYDLADKLSTEVISQSSLYDTVSLENVFLKNNQEAIWQIPPSSKGPFYMTPDGRYYIISSNSVGLYLSDNLLEAFRHGDSRAAIWIGSYSASNVSPPREYFFPHKYKHGGNNLFANATEYYTPLRLAEQYLIRAEARAHLGDLDGAKSDLNLIRKRAGLGAIDAGSGENLIKAILDERRFELFCEWGHRWFDMKRTNTVDEIMTPVSWQKGGEWKPYKRLWPIQQVEIDRNPNIIQNPGYTGTANKN